MRSSSLLLTGAVIIAFIMIVVAHFAANLTSANSSAHVSVSPASFAAALQAPAIHILDVRTTQEFASGHISSAANIDFYGSDFASRIAALDKNAWYAIYCHTGNRSGQTLALMQRLGFTHVTDLQGGIAAWEAAGYPITTN
jgi:phage shock protein E